MKTIKRPMATRSQSSVAGEARARVAGSCGELVQGAVSGAHFHISCPIDLYSQARARIIEGGDISAPPGRSKVAVVARRVVDSLGYSGAGVSIELESDLLLGKGMASSTADIGAAAAATGAALGIRLSPMAIARLALEIEPTDGTIFPGIVIFDHRKGRRLEFLGNPPPLEILLLDSGGTIDTMVFDTDRAGYEPVEQKRLERGLSLVREGLKRGIGRLVAEGATLSARVNQRILPKPRLQEVVEAADRAGALGVNVAHSGTLLGIICPQSRGLQVYRKIQASLRGRIFHLARLTGGGVFYE